jgi:phosphatidylserine/phosphatidylglycerophosphate/cardiolipin synthase-like enzyme
MRTLDLAARRVEGGFFLLRNRKQDPFTWSRDENRTQHIVGTYRNSGAPIRDALVEMLRAAKERVFVASFMLGDQPILDELIAAAERLRGGVYVVTALDERSLGRGLREYEGDEQESPEERQKNFERLTSRGIYVRGHESCHAKFVVVDNTAALVGSANLVSAGMDFTGEANVVIRDPSQVRQLVRLFGELWHEGCVWEVPPGPTYLVAERKPCKPPMKPAAPSGESGEVVWTNGSGQMSLLKAIHDTIDAAQQELTLATYSIVGMSENPALLITPLQRALERGVRIRLFVRQRNGYREQMREVVKLHDAGVQIHGDLRNHAKFVIADKNKALLFSANFDSKHGLDSGVEVGARINDPAALYDLKRYADHAIENADAEFVRNPHLGDLNGQLAARWCKRWNLDSEIQLACPGASNLLAKWATESGPCLFEAGSSSDLRLYLGTAVLKGDIQSGATVIREVADSDQHVDDRLQSWLASVRQGGNANAIQRGFCAARLISSDDK